MIAIIRYWIFHFKTNSNTNFMAVICWMLLANIMVLIYLTFMGAKAV